MYIYGRVDLVFSAKIDTMQRVWKQERKVIRFCLTQHFDTTGTPEALDCRPQRCFQKHIQNGKNEGLDPKNKENNPPDPQIHKNQGPDPEINKNDVRIQKWA